VAFTAAEAATLRRLLGYADRNRETYWLLESVLTSIEAATETEVKTLLTRVAAVETQISSGLSRAGLKRAEDVEFYASAEARSDWLEEGDRLVSQIAALLNIPVKQSAFRPRSASGPCGRG